MHVTLPTADVLEFLAHARTLDKGQAAKMPITVRAHQGHVTLLAQGGDTAIARLVAEGRAHAEGEASFYPATLEKALRKVQKRAPTFEARLDGGQVAFVAGPADFVENLEEGRVVPALEMPAQAVALPASVNDAVVHAAEFTGEDLSRPALSRVYVGQEPQGLRVAASNGHYLFIGDVPWDGGAAWPQVAGGDGAQALAPAPAPALLFPPEASAVLQDVLAGKDLRGAPMRVAAEPAGGAAQGRYPNLHVWAEAGPYTLRFVQPGEMVYPSVEAFADMADGQIAQNPRVAAKTQDVLEALDVASVFMDGGHPRADFALGANGGFRVQSRKGGVACPADVLSGQGTRPVGLNPAYVRKALKAMAFGPRVRVAWAGETDPVVFYQDNPGLVGPDVAPYRVVVMPMRG